MLTALSICVLPSIAVGSGEGLAVREVLLALLIELRPEEMSAAALGEDLYAHLTRVRAGRDGVQGT